MISNKIFLFTLNSVKDEKDISEEIHNDLCRANTISDSTIYLDSSAMKNYLINLSETKGSISEYELYNFLM